MRFAPRNVRIVVQRVKKLILLGYLVICANLSCPMLCYKIKTLPDLLSGFWSWYTERAFDFDTQLSLDTFQCAYDFSVLLL